MKPTSKIWKFAKWIVILGVLLILGAQLIRPARTNPTVDQSLSVQSQMKLDPQVDSILHRSCFDCHSNKTVWPWYTNVAPVSWFVINHVDEGRRDLNFSEWGRYDQNRRLDKLKQICKLIKAREMPLSSYTPLHPNSKLTDDDIKTLCDWSNRERAADQSASSSPGSNQVSRVIQRDYSDKPIVAQVKTGNAAVTAGNPHRF